MKILLLRIGCSEIEWRHDWRLKRRNQRWRNTGKIGDICCRNNAWRNIRCRWIEFDITERSRMKYKYPHERKEEEGVNCVVLFSGMFTEKEIYYAVECDISLLCVKNT